MVKKAQFGVEYIIVAAFALLVLSAAITVFYSRYASQEEELDEAQLKKFGNSILEASNRLAYHGDQSMISLDIILPEGVKDAYVEDSKYLVFEFERLGQQSEIVFRSNFNLAIDFYDLNAGVKNIVLETRGDYILVCSKHFDGSCDQMCSVSEKENYSNSPSDCCREDCTGCTDDKNFYFCASDGLCHATCGGHNDCAAQCDWDGALWQNELCYNCTSNCLWGNAKSCPYYCINATAKNCGSSVTHNLNLNEHCNYGAGCTIVGCYYSYNVSLPMDYCYNCYSQGGSVGEYCPLSGTLSWGTCYYGTRGCNSTNTTDCTLDFVNLTAGYEYHDLVDGGASWRLDDDLPNICNYGSDACEPTGPNLPNSEQCFVPGYKDANSTCYYEPAGILNRSDDCTTAGCVLLSINCSEGFCDPVLGCV